MEAFNPIIQGDAPGVQSGIFFSCDMNSNETFTLVGGVGVGVGGVTGQRQEWSFSISGATLPSNLES